MLNTNYYVPDEKYSLKHVYIVNFSCMQVLERRKKDENTANAALTSYILTYIKRQGKAQNSYFLENCGHIYPEYFV